LVDNTHIEKRKKLAEARKARKQEAKQTAKETQKDSSEEEHSDHE